MPQPHQNRTSTDDTTLRTTTASQTARALAAAFAAMSISHGSALDSAQAHTDPDHAARTNQREESPRALTARLMEKPISLEARAVPLDQVMGALGASAGLPIEVLWDGPRFPGGLSPQMEISLTANNLSLRAALERLAEQITGLDTSVTWQVLQDGRLQFGTKKSLNQFKERHLYDVHDLLFQHPEFSNAPKFDTNAALQQGRGGGGGAIIGEPGEEQWPSRSSSTVTENLKDLLITTVESEQWSENGGSGGAIQVFRSSFIITAPPYIHRALE